MPKEIRLPDNFKQLADDVFRTLANDWFNERITAKEAAAKIGMHEATFRKYANRIILDSFDL